MWDVSCNRLTFFTDRQEKTGLRRGSHRSMTPQRLFTLRHLSQLLTTLRLEVETLQRLAPPVMLRRTRVSNPSVQTGELNRTDGQSVRAKTDLNDFKEFLVGSIVTGKDWAVWASGLGSFIRRWKGASIVAKRSLLHGAVPWQECRTNRCPVDGDGATTCHQPAEEGAYGSRYICVVRVPRSQPRDIPVTIVST